jgi:hypothetical protein
MKIRLIYVLIIVLVAKNTNAQQLPPIQLDRPDQTECPFIVPEHYIQAENGFTFERVNSGMSNSSTPTILWKYGLHQRFEFRLITEWNTMKLPEARYQGLAPVTIGFKTSICKENGLVPMTSVICHLTTADIGSKDLHTPYLAPSFRFTMQHTLSSRFSLAYNLGAEWDGYSAAENYLYTLTTGISITEKLGCYLELYGFAAKKQKPDHRCDGGFTFLLNQNMIADISGGFALSKDSPERYLSLGFSYRFKVVK